MPIVMKPDTCGLIASAGTSRRRAGRPVAALAAVVHHEMREPGRGPQEPLDEQAAAAAVADVLDDAWDLARALPGQDQPALDPRAAEARERDVEGLVGTQTGVDGLEDEVQRARAGLGQRRPPERVEVGRFGAIRAVGPELVEGEVEGRHGRQSSRWLPGTKSRSAGYRWVCCAPDADATVTPTQRGCQMSIELQAYTTEGLLSGRVVADGRLLDLLSSSGTIVLENALLAPFGGTAAAGRRLAVRRGRRAPRGRRAAGDGHLVPRRVASAGGGRRAVPHPRASCRPCPASTQAERSPGPAARSS